jgi:F0F1-type ATP synthase membrane subunit a
MENYTSFMFLMEEINSPLDQFEIRDLLSLDASVLGNLHLSVTNLGLFLIIGAVFFFIMNTLATNFNKLVGNR